MVDFCGAKKRNGIGTTSEGGVLSGCIVLSIIHLPLSPLACLKVPPPLEEDSVNQ
jgi:hypothetical protein